MVLKIREYRQKYGKGCIEIIKDRFIGDDIGGNLYQFIGSKLLRVRHSVLISGEEQVKANLCGSRSSIKIVYEI